MLYIKAVIAGVLVSAPVGPIALLIANLVFAQQLKRAIATALGVAFADALWGFLAALGVKATFRLVPLATEWLYLIGGLLLVIAGKALLQKTTVNQKQRLQNHKTNRLATAFAFGFSLTIFNPLTLAGLLALFSVLDIAPDGHMLHSLLIALALFIGACLWWGSLVVLFYFIKQRAQDLLIKYANVVMSLILLAMGCFAIAKGTLLLYRHMF